MRACAYCDSYNEITKEHIFSSCLIEMSKVDGARIPESDEFINPNLTIKDVCIECNNEKISDTDRYICDLYEDYFSKIISEREKLFFSYDFDLLSRWILKTSFNLARASGHSETEGYLERCREYIMGICDIRPEFNLYLLTVKKSEVSDNYLEYVNEEADEDYQPPKSVVERGVLEPNIVAGTELNFGENRDEKELGYIIIINSYYFIVVFSRPESRVNRKMSDEPGVIEIPTGSEMRILNPPHLSYFESLKLFGML